MKTIGIYVLSVGLLAAISLTARAQLVLNQPNTTGTYTAPTSITLSPGFSSTGNFHAFITALLGNAASSNQNYIQRTVYLQPLGGTPPVALDVDDAMRDITYYDGLGRPMQEVAVVASGGLAYRDVVTPVVYDGIGRQHRDYLPYGTATGSGGAFKSNAVSLQATYYNSPPAGVVKIGPSGGTPSFGERKYEASPLNRVSEQGAPGTSWQLGSRTASGGRTVMSAHVTNDAATGFGMNSRRVARYGVTLSAAGTPTLTLATGAIYAAGELYVTITRDENWQSEAADGRNGTVEEYADKQGRVVLRRTYNANAVLSTYYVYDDFGRLAFVLTPGAAPDRTTLPTAGSVRNAWLLHHVYHYKYDPRGRVVEKRVPGKGREFVVYNKRDEAVATQDSVQRMKSPQQWTVTKFDAHGRVVKTGLWTYGSAAGADNRAAVQGLVNAQTAGNQWEERTGTAYTNRSWPTSGVTVLTEQFYDNYNVSGLPTSPAAYGQSTGYSSLTKGLSTVSRVNVLGTSQYLWNVVRYDTPGNAVREVKQHYKGAGTAVATNYDDNKMEYSFTRQLTRHTRQHYSAGSVSATVVTEHTYDHRDRLLDTWKKLNSGTRTLVSSNGYNDIGQLHTKKLHSTNGTSFAETVTYGYNARGWLSKAVSPKFKQTLLYEDTTTVAAKQFNGNISRQSWRHGTGAIQHYSYTYDKLNRLEKASGSSGRIEDPAYDVMGNIQSLTRGGSAMAYEYSPAGSSRLDKITGVGTTYLYDGNGNMTRDGRLNRTIAYNELDLPKTVSGSNAATYTYDATGRKLRSVIGGVTTDYIDGIEWQGTTLNVIHMEEGRILPSGTYQYVLRDHLGNTRSGFASNATATVNIRSDYYAFGLQHPTGNIVPTPKNRYLYNSKELQDGSGYYDYGARFYDPVIGRWGGVDPLAEMAEAITPYRYGFNNPIRFFDPTGMYEVDENGNIKITDEEEIEKFLRYTRKKTGASVNDMARHVFNADNGFSWMLDEVTVNGTASSYASMVSNAQGQVRGAATKISNFSGGIDYGQGRNAGLTALNWTNNIAGVAAYGATQVGGSMRFTKGGSFSLKHYASGWTGGSRARIKTYNLSKFGTGIGYGTSAVGVLLGGYSFMSSDQSWGDYGALGVSLLSSGLTLGGTTSPIGIGLGFVDVVGGFNGFYDYLDSQQQFYNHMGGVIVPINNVPMFIPLRR